MKTQYLPREWKLKQYGPGPWMDEPDHAEWIHSTGMPCIAVRIPTGAWAAYVGISATHPLYRVSHRELVLVENVVVSGFEYGHLLADISVAAVTADPAYWFFGFDYSHGDDLIPQHEQWRRQYSREPPREEIRIRSLARGVDILNPAYADFVFIRRCAERLAEELEHPERIAKTPDNKED